MSITLPSAILNLHGQIVKNIKYDVASSHMLISCRRDKRYKAIDPSLSPSL